MKEYNRQLPCHGFTLIELVVVIAIVATLAGVLLNRIWFYQEQAEKTAMTEVAAAIQTSLVLQYGRYLARGLEADIPKLATSNPIHWLAKQPPNYVGEFYDPTPHSVAPGHWVFDLKARELIYVIDHGEYFVPGPNGKKWIRYRVNLVYEQVMKAPEKTSKELAGAVFEPVETYRWFDNQLQNP